MVGSGTSTTSRQCRLEGYVLKHIARQRRQRRGCRGEWCTQEHRADCHSPPPDAWHRRTASLISPERDKSGDRPLDALSDLEVALLGLLSVRPMTGYEIKRQYARGIAPWWETPRTQIYPKLRELERRGLVRHQYIVQQGKPNKRVYSLQPHGSAALEDWLRTDIRWPDLRQHMMMRLFLGNLLPTCVVCFRTTANAPSHALRRYVRHAQDLPRRSKVLTGRAFSSSSLVSTTSSRCTNLKSRDPRKFSRRWNRFPAFLQGPTEIRPLSCSTSCSMEASDPKPLNMSPQAPTPRCFNGTWLP